MNQTKSGGINTNEMWNYLGCCLGDPAFLLGHPTTGVKGLKCPSPFDLKPNSDSSVRVIIPTMQPFNFLPQPFKLFLPLVHLLLSPVELRLSLWPFTRYYSLLLLLHWSFRVCASVKLVLSSSGVVLLLLLGASSCCSWVLHLLVRGFLFFILYAGSPSR